LKAPTRLPYIDWEEHLFLKRTTKNNAASYIFICLSVYTVLFSLYSSGCDFETALKIFHFLSKMSKIFYVVFVKAVLCVNANLSLSKSVSTVNVLH